METLKLDNPVGKRDEDHFQRYDFSKRIATLINKGKYSTSLIVGIYGKWGEGKSSVLNFISSEIKQDTLQIRFNPWYFNDEKSLIKGFFENIASAIGKKLVSKKKEILNAFENYGESIGNIIDLFVPHPIKAFFSAGAKIASKFKNDSLEYYKNEIEKILVEADCDFVIFVDDIDRLNIDEIQLIFKLVKLVGDFKRFTYVLAFDDELVASSLGHRFGGKDQKAGYDFIEKIIQLPLTLPKAGREVLKKYTINLVNESLDQLGTALSLDETEQFLSKFDTAFVPVLTNPRLAVRFANAISFAIPLLAGNICIGDLMIVEGLKIFYPKLYYFIRQNEQIFLQQYEYVSNGEELKKQVREKILQFIDKHYPENFKPVIDLIQQLFPQIKTLFINYSYGKAFYDQWHQQKKMCSIYYFDRYFTYALVEGEISDVLFDQLFVHIDEKAPEDFVRELIPELRKISLDDFMLKLDFRVESFEISTVNKLWLVLCQIGTAVPNLMEPVPYPVTEKLAQVVHKLIRRLDTLERPERCKTALKIAEPFSYKLKIFSKFVSGIGDTPEEPFLSLDKQNILADLMIEQFVNENKKIKVFEEIADRDLYSVFSIYDSLGRHQEIKDWISLEIRNNPVFINKLPRLFVNTFFVGKSGPFKGPFDWNAFSFMNKVIDIDFLYEKLSAAHGSIESTQNPTFPHAHKYSDMELVRLFQELYILNRKTEEDERKAARTR